MTLTHMIVTCLVALTNLLTVFWVIACEVNSFVGWSSLFHYKIPIFVLNKWICCLATGLAAAASLG